MLSRPSLLIALICTSSLLLAFSTWPPANNQKAHERVGGLAPLYGLQYESAIKDSYIVLFNYHVDHDDSDDYSIDNHWAHLGQNLSPTDDFVKLKYGYGATVTDAVILEKIRADANVSFVETNREITLC
jgi:hypothetical protein